VDWIIDLCQSAVVTYVPRGRAEQVDDGLLEAVLVARKVEYVPMIS
jgi:hypothetical protein